MPGAKPASRTPTSVLSATSWPYVLITAIQQVAAPFPCQLKPLGRCSAELAYPEKHDRWEEDRWLSFCEDEVARHFEDDILATQAHVSLLLFQVVARWTLP